MAATPIPQLSFIGYCPDCGERKVELPPALPQVGDDFDWRVRDYDSFRRFMLEELAARFPERTRWTAGDLEVVLVEALAAVLDQLSDMADRVAVEAYLETARRPASVRRLLGMIGYDAVRMDQSWRRAEDRLQGEDARARMERDWRDYPHLMEQARRDGPRMIHTQRRMVSVSDYALRLEEHPLVLRAHAWSEWSGSWSTIRVAIIAWRDHSIDLSGVLEYPGEIREELERFHLERGFTLPDLEQRPAIRTILRPYLEAYRMTGQEVILQDAVQVGITISLSIRVADGYFQSEVRRAVADVLGTGPGGFFEPGRLSFGEDLHAADIYQTLMAQDGVENVCLNRFKKLNDHTDRSTEGLIVLDGLEIAVCENNPSKPQNGYFRLTLHGGRKG